MKNPKVAVIVLNWNGLEDTVECLFSLRSSDYDNYKVVLIDNASDRQEGLMIKKEFPEIHLIENTVNRGFAGGNNDGINWAIENGFDYIINLNNDCIVEADWLSRLVSGVIGNKADFATSRIMYYPEKDLICSDGDALLPDGSGMALGHLEVYSGEKTCSPVFSACGAASIYSAESLLGTKIKNDEFFDELYFAYYEDVDLGVRMNMKGYKGVLVPEAVVYHKGAQTTGFMSGFHQFQIEKNRLLTEMLDFPVWLVISGEIFFCLKSVCRRIYKAFNRDRNFRGTRRRSGILGTLIVLFKARMWIICNLGDILKDRKERSRRGFISSRIIKYFYKDLARAVKT